MPDRAYPARPLLAASVAVIREGNVVGVASRSYNPLGFISDGVFFGVPIQAVCSQVLSCPGGSPPAAGPKS